MESKQAFVVLTHILIIVNESWEQEAIIPFPR
jgi:hypothetical protein